MVLFVVQIHVIVEGVCLDERFEMLWSFSVSTFISVFLLKMIIALVYQDCPFLEVSTCLCTPGVILSVLDPAGCGDGKLAYIAVQGQWSWQGAGASQSKACSVCSKSCPNAPGLLSPVHSHPFAFLCMLLSFVLKHSPYPHLAQKRSSNLVHRQAEGKAL